MWFNVPRVRKRGAEKEMNMKNRSCEDAQAAIAAGHANVERGSWGEDAAAAFLASSGWRVIERNVRPCPNDRRCEIDIIAKARNADKIVFVEVKAHAKRDESAGRLLGVDARKKRNLLRACANWIMRRRWHGAFRFDVVEVYGVPGEPPVIDHIENVPLFPPRWRFW